MTFPIDALVQDDLGPVSLGFAALVGVAFGFVLERAGFGRAQKLVAQFHCTDMTVFKVMFSAIVTAMVGVAALGAAGLLDVRALQFEYPGYLVPMVCGGLLLGAGFAMSGYCPGTSVVAAASGKGDGAVTVLGTMLGALAYAELQPALGSFHEAGAIGSTSLAGLVHLPQLALAAAVVAMALAAFKGAEAVERLVASRAAASQAAVTEEPPPGGEARTA